MTPPRTVGIGSGTSEHALLLPGLPGCVVVGALVGLLPIAVFSDLSLVLLHLPTFAALLVAAVEFSCRTRDRQSTSPILIAATVGGLLASVALMLIPAIAAQTDRDCACLYLVTWIVLPIVGLVGSALGAGLAGALLGLAWVVRRWRAQRPA
jgi:hypothetical protein